MIRDLVRQRIRRIIRMEALTGKMGRRAFIPEDPFLEEEVEKRLTATGITHSYRKIAKGSVSGSALLDNMKHLIFDMESLKEDIHDQRNIMRRMADTSDSEFEQQAERLLDLGSEAQRSEDGMPLDGIHYMVGDSFNNTGKVDLTQTTADVDVDAGLVRLKHAGGNLIDLSHLKEEQGTAIEITRGSASVVRRYSSPRCPFSNLFNSSNADKWVYTVETDKAVPITIEFSISLSPEGEELNINSVRVEPATKKSNPAVARVSWKNGDERDWQPLPTSDQEKKLDRVADWTLDWQGHPKRISDLRISLTKEKPDYQNIYVFALSEISVGREQYMVKDVLISEPLPMTAYEGENLGIYTGLLIPEEVRPKDTAIRYYLGLDEPVYGTLQDSEGNTIDEFSEAAATFVPGGSSTYYFASDLRKNSHLTGAADYADWEPDWFEVDLTPDKTASYPVVFQNHNLMTQVINEGKTAGYAVWGGGAWGGGFWGEVISTGYWRPDMIVGNSSPSLTADYTVNNRDFYQIFMISPNEQVIPGSIRVHIRGKDVTSCGRDMRIWRYVEQNNQSMYEHTGFSDTDPEITYNGTDTITIVGSGTIEFDSLRNLRHRGNPEVYAPNSDYFVHYDGDQAEVDVSPIQYAETTFGTTSRAWELTYRYRHTPKSGNGWCTMIYNRTGETVQLKINTFTSATVNVIDGIKVEALASGRISESPGLTAEQIPIEPGWNKIWVFTDNRTGTQGYINSIFDTNDPTVWSGLTAYVERDMNELTFQELTTLSGENAFKSFAAMDEEDGRTWILVPDPGNAKINADGFVFRSNSAYHPLTDDGTMVKNFYGVEYMTIKDPRKTRVMVKAELISKKKDVTPEVKGYAVLLNRVSAGTQVKDRAAEKKGGRAYTEV